MPGSLRGQHQPPTLFAVSGMAPVIGGALLPPMPPVPFIATGYPGAPVPRVLPLLMELDNREFSVSWPCLMEALTS